MMTKKRRVSIRLSSLMLQTVQTTRIKTLFHRMSRKKLKYRK